MNYPLNWSRLFQPALVGLFALMPLAAKAEPVSPPPAGSLPATFSTLTNVNINDPNVAGQVTSASQLSDLQPTDWAFQAVQSLVERYGCIAGYPDGTFRGNRAATRYEIAAALNACLDQISDRFASKDDLATVKQLQEEFKAELTTLKGRVDGLEARAKTLESQVFATATKLSGEVIFAASDYFTEGGKPVVVTGDPKDAPDIDTRPFVGNRVRLNFDTSFTGQDRLRVRLEGSSTANFNNLVPLGFSSSAYGSNMGRLGFDGGTNNSMIIDDLWYRFPIGKKAKLTVIANSGEFNDFVGNTFNPYLESSGSGAISRFGRFNPIYRLGSSSSAAGAVFNYTFSPKFALSVGYLADAPQIGSGVPNAAGVGGGGLFGGSYSALAQLEVFPTKNLGFGLTYVHTFQDAGRVALAGGTGSKFANNPFLGESVSADSAGLQFNWKVAPWLNISGWGGITFANGTVTDKPATIVNWGAAFAFPDLFSPGNLGAIVIGQEPTYVSGTSGTQSFSCDSIVGELNQIQDCDTNLHLEALYRIRINGNITVTPGLIVIINAENNDKNGTIFAPVIRTTFKF